MEAMCKNNPEGNPYWCKAIQAYCQFQEEIYKNEHCGIFLATGSGGGGGGSSGWKFGIAVVVDSSTTDPSTGAKYGTVYPEDMAVNHVTLATELDELRISVPASAGGVRDFYLIVDSEAAEDAVAKAGDVTLRNSTGKTLASLSVPKGTVVVYHFTETEAAEDGNPAVFLVTGANDMQEIDGKYTLPEGGIPADDLAAAVQTSLQKAETAVQPEALSEYVLQSALADASVNYANSATFADSAMYARAVGDGEQGFDYDTIAAIQNK